MRQMLADYLGDYDIRVTTLDSGREVADVMAREMIDLLILDLKLPGKDGMAITRRLRADSGLPIIMLTGRKDEADRVMDLELGADDYVTKPFSPRKLLARIRALLRRARAQETVAHGLAKIRGHSRHLEWGRSWLAALGPEILAWSRVDEIDPRPHERDRCRKRRRERLVQQYHPRHHAEKRSEEGLPTAGQPNTAQQAARRRGARGPPTLGHRYYPLALLRRRKTCSAK
jgi:CheY-like chemotaxis protein